jgi:hypothetical protein
MVDGQSQVFRGRLATFASDGNLVREAVVVYDRGVMDRDVFRPPFEIAHGVTAGGHQPLHEAVRFEDRRGGVVDKTRLNRAPCRRESLRLLRWSIGRIKA